MTRRWQLGLMGAALAAVAACGGGSSGSGASGTTGDGVGTPARSAQEASLPVTVTSADGRTVTVDDVSRIVPLWGSINEVVFELGLGDNVVGRDVSATFEAAADLPIVTRAHDVSAESVLSLRPTVVLADTESGPPEALEHIRNVGVPVVVFERATRVDEIGARITEIADALGVGDAGRRLAATTEAELDAVRDELDLGDPQPRMAFLYMRGQAGVYLLGGPGSGVDSVIEALGGVDAGTAMGLDRSFTPITSEAMVTAAPDVIIMTTTGLESVGGVDGMLAVPGIAQTPAGRDRLVITAEDGLLYGFGTRTADLLRLLATELAQARAGAGR